MTGEEYATTLALIAAELVATVRDFGVDDVAEVLARVPDFPDDLVGGRYGALAVVLAAMVDPDCTAAQLLSWTDWTPPAPRVVGGGRPKLPREHGSERGYQQHRSRRDMPACGSCTGAHRVHERDAQRVRRRAA